MSFLFLFQPIITDENISVYFQDKSRVYTNITMVVGLDCALNYGQYYSAWKDRICQGT